ncbi:hypothetical protein [Serratia odorifera]|uniref:Uncharacterized protein n=2 Tax=Serratia odorifera TaxID=618 RepID=D4DZ63_SEROD|nr:hypothetical protein [Serratia odorifera]EFE97121.1 hypothetical protein HMPREF0758_1213 [Serratia odorifera DSM 4582]PNK91658.1 hypothetical protein CEQ31_019240 [Serratia odorifera]RII72757.1 hypothetical protein DX901_07200 [Serratia odorifera]VDZ54931.1 Uncharacterised protein [Serratia odorifera]
MIDTKERAEFEREYLRVWGYEDWQRQYIFQILTENDLDESEYSYVGKYFETNVERCWQLWLAAKSAK